MRRADLFVAVLLSGSVAAAETMLPGRVSVPAASACSASLMSSPGLSSSSHGQPYSRDYLERNDDQRVMAVLMVQDLLGQLSGQDPDCSVVPIEIELETISCRDSYWTSPICHVPTDVGSYMVVEDYVEGYSVIYLPHSANDQTPALAFETDPPETLAIPDPAECYEMLLRKSVLTAGAFSVAEENGLDQQIHYVQLSNPVWSDIREYAVRHIQALVQGLSEFAPERCKVEAVAFPTAEVECELLGNKPVCEVTPRNGGYYFVTFDEAGAAQVVFSRWD